MTYRHGQTHSKVLSSKVRRLTSNKLHPGPDPTQEPTNGRWANRIHWPYFHGSKFQGHNQWPDRLVVISVEWILDTDPQDDLWNPATGHVHVFREDEATPIQLLFAERVISCKIQTGKTKFLIKVGPSIKLFYNRIHKIRGPHMPVSFKKESEISLYK